MASLLYLFLIYLFIYNTESIEKKIPNWIPKCKLPSPVLEECIINATEYMKPYLHKGIPEMNLPPFEPFYIPQITISQNSQGGNYKCEFSDLNLKGLTNYTFHSMRYDYTDKVYTYWMNMTLSRIQLEAKYKLEGKILMIPIFGHGNFSGNLSDVYGAFQIDNDKISKNGTDYYQIKDVKMDIIFQKNKNKLHFDNIFQGNKAIGEATRHFLRENIDFILEDVQGPIQDILIKLIKELATAFTSQFPIKEIYL